jgi:hypothetical protein
VHQFQWPGIGIAPRIHLATPDDTRWKSWPMGFPHVFLVLIPGCQPEIAKEQGTRCRRHRAWRHFGVAGARQDLARGYVWERK